MRLASGIEIPNPETILRGYIRTVCQRYDCVRIPHDSELREAEIRLSRTIGSRLSGKQVDSILAVSELIGRELLQVPDVDLLTVAEGADIPGERALSRVITFMCSIDGIGLPKTAKILHKKRPGVLPVLDTVLRDHYWPKWVPSVRGRNDGDFAFAVIRAFHKRLTQRGG